MRFESTDSQLRIRVLADDGTVIGEYQCDNLVFNLDLAKLVLGIGALRAVVKDTEVRELTGRALVEQALRNLMRRKEADHA